MARGRTRALEIGGFHTNHTVGFPAHCEPRLHVTVIHTTSEGTLCALELARTWARGLNANIRLVTTEVVPFRLPLENPPISTEFLRQREVRMVAAAGIEEKSVTIEILLCRSVKIALQQFLGSHSLVVIGGKRAWLNGPSRLANWLERIGHQVVFADAKRVSPTKRSSVKVAGFPVPKKLGSPE